MRAWLGALAGVALIALAYAGDQVVGAAFEEGRRTFTNEWAVALDGVTRVLAVILMAGLGWLVFRGPRERLPGLVMLVVGGYFALVPPLSFALLANTGIRLPPFTIEAYQYPTNLVLWTGAVVMVLGMVELLWPTARSAHAGTAPQRSASGREISSSHP